MKPYTLHVSEHAFPGDREALENAEVVPDRFSWLAFGFTVLWFFFKRLWLAGLAVAVLLAALHGVLAMLDVDPLAATAAQLLVGVLIGLEANSLQRWTYARRGRPARDLVLAANREDAEAKAFARWLEPARMPPAATTRGASAPYRGSPVLGLFPEPERGL